MIATERRQYALIRITAGDYVLPSNDRKTVWRIARYEDGPSHGLDEMPRDREFWGVWKWRYRLETRPITVDDWDLWEFMEGLYDKRGEAIDAAMRLTPALTEPARSADKAPIDRKDEESR